MPGHDSQYQDYQEDKEETKATILDRDLPGEWFGLYMYVLAYHYVDPV